MNMLATLFAQAFSQKFSMHAHELIILSKNSEYISILSKNSEFMPMLTNNSVTDIIHTKLAISLNIHAEEFHVYSETSH